MPYIQKKDRIYLKQALSEVLMRFRAYEPDSRDAAFTYLVYSIAKKLYGEGNWHTKARVLLVLESAKQEWYRRVIAPYEDLKIIKNGDI